MNHIEWLEFDNNVKLTSLVLWDEDYESFQAIIFRKDEIINRDVGTKHETPKNVRLEVHIEVFGNVYKVNHVIDHLHLYTEQEIMFQLSFFIRNTQQKIVSNILNKVDMPTNDKFNDLFMDNTLRDELSDQHGPDFGFYSLAYNFDFIKNYFRN